MSGFVKLHTDAASAAEASRRSAALRAHGVPTPAARSGQSPRGLCFDLVDGETGRALAEGDLAPLLSVVAQMHRTRVTGLSEYDPFRRVRRRLSLATRLPVADILAEPVPTGRATLHGDLHVGQFIRSPAGEVWIVDLDDMARGPSEADLANFAAHLATTLTDQGIARCSERVLTAWARLGLALEGTVFKRFLRFALLRRHLKLREAGRPDFESEILAYLRDSSNFSIL